jgi:hypothetical protein
MLSPPEIGAGSLDRGPVLAVVVFAVLTAGALAGAATGEMITGPL